MYDTEYKRKFLVVIDETEGCDRALTFAAFRVKRTGGTVVLTSVVAKPDFIGLGVEDELRADAVEGAERNLDKRLARIREIGGIRDETGVREGNGPEQIDTLLGKAQDIAILVLAASRSAEGPGRLVNHFAARATILPIPLTIVPGRMTDEEIIAIC